MARANTGGGPAEPADCGDYRTIRRATKVGWFAIRQILATGGQVVVATIVGSMSGRREILAATASPDLDKYVERDEVWIDYVADSGDGWRATASVAWLLGRNTIRIGKPGEPVAQRIPPNPEPDRSTVPAGSALLPAGDILILGGDQVYPTASSRAYQTRLVDPYQSARYRDGVPRDVYAVPGNHDWYDGLISFVRLFCQTGTRWIGAWATQQHRSYFAVRLPHQWHLWGLDLALNDDLDQPQIDYFAARAAELEKDAKVILCVPNPTWLKQAAQQESPEGIPIDRTFKRPTDREAEKLNVIIDHIVEKSDPGRVPVILTGDLHFYARHERFHTGYALGSGKADQFIVCGGGGAFTLGTARVPEIIRSGVAEKAEHRKSYPSAAESNRLRWGALLFPWTSMTTGLAVAAIQTAIFLMMHYVSKVGTRTTWLDALNRTDISPTGLVGLYQYVQGKPALWPVTVVLGLLVVVLALAFARTGRPGSPRSIVTRMGWVAVGAAHAFVQLLAGVLIFWTVSKFDFQNGSPSIWVAIDGFVLVGIASGVIFGIYLLLSNRFAGGMHEQEVFSCQALERYKCFLRIHVSRDGLVIYPIGLRRVARKWKTAPGVTSLWTKWRPLFEEDGLKICPGATRLFDPVSSLEPELIEGPVKVT